MSSTNPMTLEAKPARIGIGNLDLHQRKKLWGLAFVLPVTILFTVFNIYPMINAVYYSFFKYDMLTQPIFVGLGNYQNVLTDPLFQRSVLVTFVYIVIGGPLNWVIAFSVALILSRPFRLNSLYRAIIFMPAILSIVPSAIIWKVLLQPYGPINALLGTQINWLTDTRTAIFGVIIMSVWRGIGFYMTLFLVGLQSIPAEYLEAASIDGAGRWNRFRYIMLPLLRPTIAFVIIVTLITGLQQFVQMYIMTRGGPDDWTKVLTLRIFETGFNFFEMGRAMSMSVLMFLFIMVFTLFQLRLFRTEEEKETV